MRIHHIGYLVKDLNKATERFKQLGYTIAKEKTYDKYRKIDIVFLSKDGYIIELVSSVSSDSIVAGLYKKIKNSPYHICYETDSFDNSLSELLHNGFVQLGEVCPAPAIGDKRVVFLMDSMIGMIELVEK